MSDELTSIKIRKATRDVLKSVGKKGETYDAIINRLLDRVLRRKHTRQSGSQS
ncbi:MAG: hypothetical protein NWE82_00025 [Candidatus Bathyarchaeota archaeon]|nr:hypothetical protein [Candidatus Bathyarchaeota archaeon]